MPARARSLLGAFLLLVALAACAGPPTTAGGGGAANACMVDAAAQDGVMRRYAGAGPYTATQTDAPDGVPSSVSVVIPPLRFDGPGRSATLPIGPCQTIYRYQYRDLAPPAAAVSSPFSYVEVDWNTEGLPRGPHDSFVAPHFDFHFYRRPRAWVEANTMCVSSDGRTCDAARTDYDQMQRFLALPPGSDVPATYRPDVGSSIPEMGMHLLDASFNYTVDSVDHHPTLIYGTFDREVLFAESSVTLTTLQDAVASPTHMVSFPYAQPLTTAAPVAWPARFTVRHIPETGEFRVAFEDFHLIEPAGTRPGAFTPR